jgi:hypothetical protein
LGCCTGGQEECGGEAIALQKFSPLRLIQAFLNIRTV